MTQVCGLWSSEMMELLSSFGMRWSGVCDPKLMIKHWPMTSLILVWLNAIKEWQRGWRDKHPVNTKYKKSV